MTSFKAQFVKSASHPADYPTGLPEIALIGRSNAGKSSLLNALCHQKIAKVSATPGKTQLLNFFNVADTYHLVDLPGYGYAQRSKTDTQSWKKMIETYLKTSPSLIGLILVIDIRRNWSEDETQLLEWINQQTQPKNVMLVLNKSDKLKNLAQNLQKHKIQIESQIDDVFIVSCNKNQGIKELQKHIYHLALSFT